MTTKMIKYSVVPLSLCAASATFGQNALTPLLSAPDGSVPPVQMGTKEDPQLNQIRMGMQLGFNMKASFKNIGRFRPASNPGSTNAFSNHYYDDGTNAVDSTGNQHFSHFDTNGNPVYVEGTWFWGFTGNNNFDVNGNGAQVQGNGTANGTIAFHSVSSSGGSTGDRVDDPQPGFSLTFARQMFQDEKNRWRAGLEAGFGYTDFDIKDDHPVNAKGSMLTDTYSLEGSFVPVGSSYGQDIQGNPNGITIGDVPTRSISAAKLPVSGTREFGADVFAFKLGPYFEVPLNHTFSLGLEGGVAMVYVYSKFQFNEQVANPITGTITTVKGNGNNQDLLFGGYVGSYISAALNDQWTLFAGAQLQDVGNYTHRNHGTGEAAVLDLSQSIFFSAGLGYSF